MPMRHQADHTAHDERRELIDPKFRHGAEGVIYKRVVESAEIADDRARGITGAPRGHGRRTGIRRPEELRPGEMRTAEKKVDEESKLRQGAGRDGSSGRSDGGAGNRRTRWRVEKRTKNIDPAVHDPPVAEEVTSVLGERE